MKIKKCICLLAALLLVLSLAACAEDDGKTTEPTGDPDLTAFSNGLDDNGYFKDLRALDYVELPDFKNMEVPEFSQLTDKAVEDGDFVNIDYVGTIDGVAFQGGSTQGEGTDVIIGVTSYIDDFLEQIVGHKPGENFDIVVTFPENYGVEELNGKDATFNITVNYIWDVTDEKAAAIGFSDKETMAQYVAYNNVAMEDVTAGVAVNLVITAAQCETIPDAAYDTVYAQLKLMLTLQASQYGLDANTFVQYVYGASTAEEYLASQAPLEAKWHLVFQAVSEQENILVTDADIEDAGYTDLVDVYKRPYVAYNLLQEMVSHYLEDNMG